MKIACLHRLPVRQGSAHKFFTYLADNHGAVVVDALAPPFPDLVVVRGDRYEDWRVAQAAGVPYIVIEHDCLSLRSGTVQEADRERIEAAAGAIFISEAFAAFYEAQGWRLPPYRVIHLRPLARELEFAPKHRRRGRHLVYAGSLMPPAARSGQYGYRCYHAIFDAFRRAGWTVHAYPTRPGMAASYPGVHAHRTLPYGELLRELSQYGAGFQGYNVEGVRPEVAAYVPACRPNKLWDYLAAGIPTIGFQGGDGMQLYVDGGWGVVLEELTPAAIAGLELPGIREATRRTQVLEADAQAFREVLGC